MRMSDCTMNCWSSKHWCIVLEQHLLDASNINGDRWMDGWMVGELNIDKPNLQKGPLAYKQKPINREKEGEGEGGREREPSLVICGWIYQRSAKAQNKSLNIAGSGRVGYSARRRIAAICVHAYVFELGGKTYWADLRWGCKRIIPYPAMLRPMPHTIQPFSQPVECIPNLLSMENMTWFHNNGSGRLLIHMASTQRFVKRAVCLSATL